ncbi:NF038122 family metalloprotease [Alkalinema pantanalense CENA528]|uniref:NF038122 family metalloprotease n=1 Tax=Alkalinema pantanalense TaxID=1620705 RepID=UPI003D6DB9BC
MQLNFTFDPGTSLQQMIGIETAGKVWSQYLTDNVSLNIHVGVSSSLPASVIGGALPAISAKVPYGKVRTAMSADRRSADDNTAFFNLSSGSTQTANFDWMTTDWLSVSLQSSTQRSINTLNLTNANAKALGLSPNGAALDGYILLGANVPWSYDFTRSTAASNNQVDFLSTALHEIGHILGFISGVDDPIWTTNVYNAYKTGQLNTTYNNIISNRAQNATTLDLFRFNYNKSSFFPDLSYGQIGGRKGFSIDDGLTFIQSLSSGDNVSLSGDGQQASHWSRGTNAIMAPTISLGQRMSISNSDLRAMDVLGWDLATAGINTTINLSSLQSQAKQSLASRLGQTVTWLDANQTLAAQQLGQDRSKDIEQMIHKSVIYKWGDDGDGWWQKLVGVFNQQSLFSSLNDLTTNSVSTNQTSANFTGDSLFSNYLGQNVTLNFGSPNQTDSTVAAANLAASIQVQLLPQGTLSGSYDSQAFSLAQPSTTQDSKLVPIIRIEIPAQPNWGDDGDGWW